MAKAFGLGAGLVATPAMRVAVKARKKAVKRMVDGFSFEGEVFGIQGFWGIYLLGAELISFESSKG